MSPENIRFHAAGHLAAAVLLVQTDQVPAAKTVLQTVQAYVNHEKVNAPDQLKAKVAANALNPDVADLILLEQWFVDPMNTHIERSGG